MLFIILLSMLMILLSALNVIRHLVCGNNQNWLLNLNLIYEILDWVRKCLVDFNAGKTQLVLCDQSNNTGAIDVKMNGSVLEENLSFKMLGLTFFSKLGCSSYIISIAKTASKQIRALIHSMKFLFLRLFCISINQPYGHAWNTIIMSRLVFLVATWNCWISYKNGYTGLLVIHFLPLLNPWLNVEMQSA